MTTLPVILAPLAQEVRLPQHPVRVIGIDLGTTNSTVAELVWRPEDGTLAPVTLPTRPPQEQLAELIREEAGNISAVARRLQVCSRTIYRWLRSYGLELKDFRLEADREAGVG